MGGWLADVLPMLLLVRELLGCRAAELWVGFNLLLEAGWREYSS